MSKELWVEMFENILMKKIEEKEKELGRSITGLEEEELVNSIDDNQVRGMMADYSDHVYSQMCD